MLFGRKGPPWQVSVKGLLDASGVGAARWVPRWPPRDLVVAVDGTAATREALPWATAFAAAFRTRNVAACASTHSDDPTDVVFNESDDAPAKTLAQAQQAFATAGLAVTPLELQGRPRAALREHCIEARPDLLVLGTHQHRRHPASGVASDVKNLVPCHLLVVHGDLRPGPVLAAYDGSPQSEHALAAALDVARTWGTTLDVVQATDPGKATAGGFTSRGVEVRCRDVPGAPRDVLRQLQASEGHRLLVMGGTGRGGTPGWTLGSVSDELSQAMPVSVLVLKALGPGRP